ncbi:hypothetical protein NDU88_004461 [Pleurodeles waltl]|uniref:Uncharacterized protein n=1 Tax=Pleurodeles waltl TaxID=8319 RepID=A0AAV7WRX2_PLEWA|nr:hypothetical protein NDU88_004461 [Pleurodeles waltl]
MKGWGRGVGVAQRRSAETLNRLSSLEARRPEQGADVKAGGEVGAERGASGNLAAQRLGSRGGGRAGGVYGPNVDDPEFFGEVWHLLNSLGSGSMLWGGDFNVVLASEADRKSRAQPQHGG